MHRLLAAIALLIAAFPALAGVSFDPPAPTSQSFVRLLVSNAWVDRFCYPRDPVIERSDRVFDIRFTSEGCTLEVGGWAYDLPLGVLEAGLYTIRFWHNGELQRTDTFPVTSADAPVKIFPSFASIRGGSPLLVVQREDHCTGALRGAALLIDGIEVPVTEENDGCALTAVAPAHAAGPVNVAVRTAGGSILTAPYALRYLDPAAPVDTAVFERVLIPILYNGPGAFGSQWRSETKLEQRTLPVDWFHDFERAACDGPCSTLPALSLSDFRDHPAGLIVTVPREKEMVFSLRIRDVSRTGSSYGTEVPIAREEDFQQDLAFANVPFDPRYRLMLRLYSMSGVSDFVQVVTDPNPRSVRLIGPCAAEPCASAQPAFAAVDLTALFPAFANQQPRTVRVFTGLGLERYWGFITVTNNETQQVTVISPMR
jgi:hypothetical protein